MMRWNQVTILSIALISALHGGYLITAMHTAETRYDAKIKNLSNQLTRLKTTLTEPTIQGKLKSTTQSGLSSKADAISSLRKDLDLLKNQFMSMNDETIDNNTTLVPNEQTETSTFEAQATQIAQSFDSEIVDSNWGTQAELKIKTELESDAPDGTYIISTQCRSTTCKIEMDFDDAIAKLKGMQSLPLRIPWTGETLLRNDDSIGENGVVVYVARQGETLSGEQYNEQ